MEQKTYTSFREFYPYYLNEHGKTGTRITHFVGTTAFIVLLIYGLLTFTWWFIAAGIVAAYGMAWVGHFFIEKNKPATFKYPLWSLMGDFKLYFDIITGKTSLKGE